jgi:pSer/pThr/pTyr-binding forkhead associated (FHA) protein
MTDPILERFAQCCGMQQALELRIHLQDGEKLAEGEIESPFVLVGRDDACDVTLTDPEVDPRHLWLQVLEGQVYAVDLGSRAGLLWSDGRRGSGWLRRERSLGVGPFVLVLQRPPAERAERETFPEEYQPLQSDAALAWHFPTVVLEFRNGRRARDRWQVNRRLTLIGRAPECKIRLSAEDISRYHCGLVFTARGLWIVDLSGRGVVVNGERMRVSPLEDGADLWVGRFRIGVQVGAPGSRLAASAGPGEPVSHGSRPSASALEEPQRGTPAEPPPPLHDEDDEVPLGVLPSSSSASAAGLSSSHIMAEAFPPGAGSGEVSQSILIAQSGSLTPPPQPRPSEAGSVLEELSASLSRAGETGSSAGSSAVALGAPSGAAAAETREEGRLVLLLREIGQLHQRMAALLQQSCALLVEVGAQLPPGQQAALEETLHSLRRVSESLQGVHAELARWASETPREIRHPPPRVRPPAPPAPIPSPFPPPSPAPPGPTGDADDPPGDATEAAILNTLPHARVEPRSRSRHNSAG